MSDTNQKFRISCVTDVRYREQGYPMTSGQGKPLSLEAALDWKDYADVRYPHLVHHIVPVKSE